MRLKVLSSGSWGNCYLLETNKECLILDAGIPIREIKRGLNFELNKVIGVVCSHAHRDHSKSVADLENMGIPIFKPFENNIKIQEINLGSFFIQSFPLPHNKVENRGFVIEIAEQKILYMTDFEYCRYRFVNLGINHMLIECNYCKELIDKGIPNYKHKLLGHCELETCKEFIRKNTTDELRNIILCHLSGNDSDPVKMMHEIKKVSRCGIKVAVATAGLELNLDNLSF